MRRRIAAMELVDLVLVSRTRKAAELKAVFTALICGEMRRVLAHTTAVDGGLIGQFVSEGEVDASE